MQFAFTPSGQVAFPTTPEAASVVEMAGGTNTVVSGHYLSVLPSTLEATHAAWAGGVYVPGPIQNPHKFDWPSMSADFRPMAHQVQTADFITVFPRNFVLNRPGTGKTAATIWAAEYMLRQNVIDRVVIVCPRSCMEEVWLPELAQIAPLRNVAVAHGKSKIAKALQGNRDYIVLNHDGVSNKSLLPGLQAMQKTQRVYIIVDEATAFKNWTAARTKNLSSFADAPHTRLSLLTGTPHAKDPTDIYGMCRVRDKHSVPSSFTRWRDMVMDPAGRFRWSVKPDAGERVREALYPAICFDSKDCVELPLRHEYGFGENPVANSDFKTRGLELTDQQRYLIQELKDFARAEIASGIELTVAHAAALRNKLFQIAQGVVLDDQKVAHPVDCTPRLNDLLHALSRGKKKFIVFADYKAVSARIAEMLAAYGYRAEIINGDVSPTKRAKRIADYKSSTSGVHGLIAHPQTLAHGLTLVEGDTTFWWGPPSSPEHFDQGNHRQFRKGQKDAVHMWAQAASSEEELFFEVLQERGSLEKATLRMFNPAA